MQGSRDDPSHSVWSRLKSSFRRSPTNRQHDECTVQHTMSAGDGKENLKEELKKIQDELLKERQSTQAAEEMAKEAEKRAEEAEKKVMEAEKRIEEAEKKVREAEKKVREAEKKTEVAENIAMEVENKTDELEKTVKEAKDHLLNIEKFEKKYHQRAMSGKLTEKADKLSMKIRRKMDGKKGLEQNINTVNIGNTGISVNIGRIYKKSSTTNEQLYQKTAGAANMSGELYEVKMVALLFCRALHNEHVFQIASNMNAAGAFDDIIFTLGSRTMFLQLKHRSSFTRIKETQLFQQKGDFSLFKYYKSYCDIKQQWERHRDLRHCGRFQDAIFIVYTNAMMDLNTQFPITEDWQAILNSGGTCFQLTMNYYPQIEARFLLEAEDKYDIPSIEEFLSQLWFFTEQAPERELDVFISHEIGTLCQVTGSLQDKICQTYLNEVQNWWQNSNYFLTNTAAFWLDILATLTSKPKLKQLETINLTFSTNELDNLKPKLPQIGKWLHIVTKDTVASTTLSCLKIHQCMKNEKHLIVDGNMLLTHTRQILALWGTWCDLLVIVDDGKTPANFLCSHPDKRLVYLSGSELLEENNSLHDNPNFEQLNDDSQECILNTKVNFQGYEIFLRNITMGNGHLESTLNADVLYQLQNEKAILGDALLPEDNFYIPRTLQCQQTISTQIFQIPDQRLRVAISGISEEELRELVPKNEQVLSIQRYIYLRCRCKYIVIEDENDFKKVAKLQTSVHWLHYEGNVLVWKQSSGDLDVIQRYLNEETSSFENVNSALDVPHQVAVVAAEPGMGKSTLLTHLAHGLKQDNHHMWVIRVDLNDFTKQLEQFPQNSQLQHVIDFLIEVSRVEDKWKELFRSKLQFMENVCTLFDGYDETSTHSDKVDAMLRILQTTEVKKIWVTTRPNMRSRLENELCTLVYTLQPFSESDQRNFLAKFWKSRLPDIDGHYLNNFITELLKLTVINLNDRDKEFTGIPLQSMLLAEAFENTLITYAETGDITIQNFDLLKLYDKFVDKKLLIRWEKNQMDMTKSDLLHLSKQMKKEYKERHMTVAIVVLLQNDIMTFNNSETILEEYNSFIRDFEQGKEKLGIIKDISNGEPVFVHRTFAEYFSAMWFANNCNDDTVRDYLKEKLFDKNFQVMRNFFDRMLAQNLKLHSEVFSQNLNFDEELLSAQINRQDKGGRTVLHLAVLNYLDSNDRSWNLRDDIVRTLLRRGGNLELEDTVLHWRPLHYLDEIINTFYINKTDNAPFSVLNLLLKNQRNREDLIKTIENLSKQDYVQKLMKKAISQSFLYIVEFMLDCGIDINYEVEISENTKMSLLHAAYESRKHQLVEFLIDKGSDIDQYNREGLTLLHRACKEDDEEYIQLLIDKGSNINKQDIDGDTALHRAARRGDVTFCHQLIQRRADINTPGKLGNTVLHEAVIYDNPRIIKFCFEHEADVTKTNDDGNNILHIAALLGKANLVELLLHKELHADCLNSQRKTPLQLAVLENHMPVICLLIERIVNINNQDKDGNTPLHDAVKQKHEEIFHYLIDHGANPDIENSSQETPCNLGEKWLTNK